jgi:hypothetical protein
MMLSMPGVLSYNEDKIFFDRVERVANLSKVGNPLIATLFFSCNSLVAY